MNSNNTLIYENKDWLETQINNKLNLHDMAKISNTNFRIIENRLKRFNLLEKYNITQKGNQYKNKIKYCEICNVSSEEARIIYYKKEIYLCDRHRCQMKEYGKILDYKTFYDKNDYVLYEDYAEILLYNKIGNETGRAIIDIDKVDLVKPYRWGRSIDIDNRYVVATINEKITALHNFLMNPPVGFVVDHIDGNRLNNKLNNLRLATEHQNHMNQKLNKNNTSGARGVWFNKQTEKWVSEIKFNYKKIYLGSYINFEDAVNSRLIAEQKYFGDFSPSLSRKEV